ncbi:MAG: hypothetical protein ABI609_13700 [Acidobacteriota bacterium]
MRLGTFLFHLGTAASLSLALAVAPAAASSHRNGDALHVEIHGDHDDNVSLTLGGWVGDLVRAIVPAHVRCNGDRDDRVVAVLEFLDRHGEGSRYTLWDDGREFTGARDHGRFELRIGQGRRWNHHGKAHVEAPWAIAQCMMGRSISVADLLGHGDRGFNLQVSGDHGEVRISLP